MDRPPHSHSTFLPMVICRPYVSLLGLRTSLPGAYVYHLLHTAPFLKWTMSLPRSILKWTSFLLSIEKFKNVYKLISNELLTEKDICIQWYIHLNISTDNFNHKICSKKRIKRHCTPGLHTLL